MRTRLGGVSCRHARPGIVAAAIVGAVSGLAVGYAMFGRGERLYFGLLFGGAGGMIGGMTVAHLLPRGRFLR